MLTHAISAKKYLFIAFAVAACLALTVPFAAHAASPVATCQTKDGTQGVRTALSVGGSNCVPLGQPGIQNNPIFIYVTGLLKIVSALAGVAMVGGFMWGGILYITARANASQVEKAKVVMVNSVIGLLMFIFMYAILQFLVPGGIFTT